MRRRLPLSLCLLGVLAGCAARSAAPGGGSGGGKSFDQESLEPSAQSAERTPRAMWAVRSFDEKAGWLDAQPALAATTGSWGERMAAAVSRSLDARRVESQVIPKDVTSAQMEVLFKQGLQYLCEGTLSSVAVADGNATLRAAYRLKRRVNDDTRTVQARVIEASAPIKALDDASMQALIDTTAGKIADAVVADVPADLLAIRG